MNGNLVDNTASVVRGPDDLRYGTVPVTYYRYQIGAGHVEEIHDEHRAVLYHGEPRVATLLNCDACGNPHVATVKLVDVYVGPSAQHAKALHVTFKEKRRRSVSRYTPMPLDGGLNPIMIAWGAHVLDIEQPDYSRYVVRVGAGQQSQKLPDTVLWNNGVELASRWRECRRCFLHAAGDSVWLDMVEHALKMFAEKYPERMAELA